MSSEFESGRQAFIKMFIPHLQHSVKPYDKDFHKTPNFERPHISSKITGKQVYVTPYYVSTGVEAFHAMGFKGKEVKLGIIDTVAPEATLGTYRIFYCKGRTSTSLVLQAIIAATKDQTKNLLPENIDIDKKPRS
ncbi:hypothetical protein BDF19DRAFT_427659 [Syncephalis fuscata]|nr:hypothetical protein BDF19DRAFT_427659 [Syncephalis fuscata]